MILWPDVYALCIWRTIAHVLLSMHIADAYMQHLFANNSHASRTAAKQP